MIYMSIKDYENYEVSDTGSVRNKATKRVLRPCLNKSGYQVVSLYNGHGKQVKKLVHRLVSETFIGECPDGYEVDHRDKVKTNNDVTNLRYVTHVVNEQNRRTTTGEPYISARANGYAVSIRKLGYYATVHDLATAIKLRDRVMEHNGLSFDELNTPPVYPTDPEKEKAKHDAAIAAARQRVKEMIDAIQTDRHMQQILEF